jgi:hypothetical protein
LYSEIKPLGAIPLDMFALFGGTALLNSLLQDILVLVPEGFGLHKASSCAAVVNWFYLHISVKPVPEKPLRHLYIRIPG